MIYGIIVCQIDTGKVFCKATFDESMTLRSDLFGNFFTAINHIFREFFQRHNKDIDMISFGDLKVRAKSLELNNGLSLLVAYDKLDEEYSNELFNLIIDCLMEYEIILDAWDGCSLDSDTIISEAIIYTIRQWINIKVLSGDYNGITESLFNDVNTLVL